MSSSSNVSGSRHSNTNDPKGLDEKLRRASLASGILSTPNQRNSITASSSSSSSSSSPSSSTLATAAAATMTVQASPSPQSLDHVLSPDRVDTPPQQSTIIRFRDDPHHQHHQHQRVSITSTAPLSSPISPSSSSTSTSSPSPSSSSNQIPAHPLLLPSSAAYSECLVMRILGRLCDHLPRLAVMSATTTSASNAVLAEFAAKGLCEKIGMSLLPLHSLSISCERCSCYMLREFTLALSSTLPSFPAFLPPFFHTTPSRAPVLLLQRVPHCPGARGSDVSICSSLLGHVRCLASTFQA